MPPIQTVTMKDTALIRGLLALGAGLICGFYFGNSTNDIWFGGIIGLVLTVSLLGLLLFPDELIRTNPPKGGYWQLLLALLTVLVMVTPQMSGVFSVDNIYAVMIFMFGTLISGATIGLGVAQSANPD